MRPSKGWRDRLGVQGLSAPRADPGVRGRRAVCLTLTSHMEGLGLEGEERGRQGQPSPAKVCGQRNKIPGDALEWHGAQIL